VAGYTLTGINPDFALARYTSTGSLDTTFSSDGKLTTAIGTSTDNATALAVQSDGKIVVAGFSRNGSNDDFALARYNSGTAPTISNITDQTTNEDTPTSPISFTVGDVETAAGSLIVTASSNNQTLVPDANIALGGSGADRTITITPAANQNGTATITVQVSDGSLTASDSFVLTVNPVNDAPSFTKGADQSVAEDAGAQNVSGWATAISPGPANESSQTVSFLVTNDNNGLFAVQPEVASDGTLSYTPAANAFGSATVTVQAKDDGGTANGGVDTSAPQTFTITVNAVNDAPVVANVSKSGTEDTTVTFGASDFTSQFSDVDGDSLSTIQITSLPANGTLKLSGVDVTLNQEIPAASLDNLTFDPAANWNGSDSFDWNASDGTAYAATGALVNITIAAVNDAPVAADDSASVAEDTLLTVAAPGVLANDSDIESDPLTAQIVSSTSHGSLTLYGDGSFSYTPDANYCGSDSFQYQATDGALNSATATVTITVTCVNDAPVGTDDTLSDVAEDSGARTIPFATLLANDQAGPPNESGQSLTITAVGSATGGMVSVVGTDVIFTPAADFTGAASFSYTLADDGTTNDAADPRTATATVSFNITAVNDAPVNSVPGAQTVDEDTNLVVSSVSVSDVDAGASDVQVTLSALNGTLTLDTTVAGGVAAGQVSGNGSGSVVITAPLANINATLASASGLTYRGALNYNGGDTLTVATDDQGNTGGAALSDSDTIAITVGAVNDAPTLDPVADVTIDEDAAAQTLSLSGIGTGAANESQALTVTATSGNPALIPDPTVTYSSPDASGTLSFTPVAAMNGTATITLTVTDDGATANGGVDTLVRTFSVTVVALNDAPTLAALANLSVMESAPMQTVNLSGISAGPADEASQSLTVTAVSSNPALIPNPSVTYTSPDATGTLSFTPVAGRNGAATITMTVTDSGSSVAPHATTFTRTFTVFVGAVNNQPTLDRPTDRAILEDAGTQTVSLTGISAGSANESGQRLTVTAVSSNPALVPNPSVTYTSPTATGSLRFTPTANASGKATITVTVRDDGGAANGGIDTVTKAFVITIAPVNDAPSFTKGANQTVMSNVGAQTVAAWATGFTPGPADEAGQTLLAYQVMSNSNPALFTSAPALNQAGTLTYMPKAGASGTATIGVVARDSGGTANGGVNTSAVRTFTITVRPLYRVYLPLVQRAGTPDLVISSVSLNPNKTSFSAGEPVEISVVVENRGTAPAAEFWVDLSINPDHPPTTANQIWNEHCAQTPCYGLAWFVEGLAPGARITLTSKALPPGYSIWPGFFVAGTTDLYAYADSYNPGAATGAVAESDEANNQFHLGGLTVTGPNPAQASLQAATDLPARPVHLRK
jgi:uncharacterized delta-60 repeat protein